MMKVTASVLRVCCLSLILAVLPAVCPAADTIRINGTGNALDMMKRMVAAYRKINGDVNIIMVNPLGSSGAIKALLAGALDVAVTGRGARPEEEAKGGRSRKYGVTPLVIATCIDVGLSDITSKQLEDIYVGKVGRWPNGERIRLVLRPLQDTDTKLLRTLSPAMDKAIDESHNRSGMIVAITDQESYTAISKTLGGVGTASLNSIVSEKPLLAVLSLNGVKPSLKTLANGSYPLGKEIHFIITATATPATLRLMDFIFSSQGRAIARQNGVLVTAGPESPVKIE